MINTKAVYKTNEDFKSYVDNYARERQILVTDALNHKMVEEVANYYLQKDVDKIDEGRI